MENHKIIDTVVDLFISMMRENYVGNYFGTSISESLGRKNILWRKLIGSASYSFISICSLFREHSRLTDKQGKGEGLSLTLQKKLHPYIFRRGNEMYNELIRDLYFGVFLVLGFPPNTAILQMNSFNMRMQFFFISLFFIGIFICWNIFNLFY